MAEPEPTYDPSHPRGGDPTKVDVNKQYSGIEAHFVYIALCGFVVFLILPGIGLLYAGMARRKSALTLLFQSFLVTAVITVQWMFWGYSLAYGQGGGPYIGNLHSFGLKNVMAAPSSGSPVIPEIVYCMFELLFCACTVMLVIGGAFERGNILPSMIFGFCWATIVYCPLAHWTWDTSGWLYNLPSLDFAGGGPVHIASGWTALAYAVMLGKRKGYDELDKRPHNPTLVFLGTAFIWTGWFGFNGGTALTASIRAMLAVFNTNAGACGGVLGWVTVDFIRYRGRFSAVGACEGAIAGLVGITPGAGLVSPWLAVCIGFITGIVCALCRDFNKWVRIDEGMDVFKLHGIGGMVGAFLTGIFASAKESMLDGQTDQPGGIDGNGVQVGKQFAEICAISAYSFVVSCVLLCPFKFIPWRWLSLRVDEESETAGLDSSLLVEEQIGDWNFLMSTSGLAVNAKPQETVVQDGFASEKDKTDQKNSDESL